MAKNPSRRRRSHRDLRQNPPAPEIEVQEIDAAPPNDDTIEYHSENDIRNDNAIDPPEIDEEIDENELEGYQISQIW